MGSYEEERGRFQSINKLAAQVVCRDVPESYLAGATTLNRHQITLRNLLIQQSLTRRLTLRRSRLTKVICKSQCLSASAQLCRWAASFPGKNALKNYL